MEQPIFTPEQEQEMRKLKSHFPYRLVWGALKDGNFETHATHDRRKLNKYLRDGWTVAVVG